ncbi:MAG: hypothetical protein ACFFDT_38105 [Candidatus Hodarchaeota archaeon]
MIRPSIVISLIVGLVLLSALSFNKCKAETQDSSLLSYTFNELGYNTTQTYHRGGSLTLNVNCSGSSLGLYSVNIYLHITGEDTYFFYQINGGPERSEGGPGDAFFTGWQENYFEPGFFREGTNSIEIIIYNYPLSDQTSTLNKFLTIMPDSYLEIYDATALPLDVEWQGYNLTVSELIVRFFICEKLTRIPVDDVNVTVKSSIQNTTAIPQGNGVYKVIFPSTIEMNTSLIISIEKEGYSPLSRTFSLDINMSNSDLISPVTGDNLIGPILFGIFLGILLSGVIFMFGKSKTGQQIQTQLTLIRPFYCGMCGQWHRFGTHRWRCISCGRSVCRTAYDEMKSVGRIKCHLCEGELRQI